MHSGFTLLEILIALFVFTLIGLASHSVLNTVLDTDQLSGERFDKLRDLQRAMTIIERDLQQAVERKIRIEGESSDIVISGGLNAFESDADGLAFVRAGWANPKLVLPRSTLQTVGYRLQGDELQRVYSNYVDNVIGAEPKVRVLLQDIEDLQFQFRISREKASDDNNNQWQDTYTGSQLPYAITIEIVSTEFGLIRREFSLATGLGVP
ncbi:type II secretion system minor pseudopilin GspJ [Planctobacterium marinum]|uniref:type II secretion system minor pseudopilin GspJ n=1 Tax=Planctobacterium marinum TaxID=1631968 RepID=UPI001E421137|nr:type II secretion system minor pseudopilin GspJ [Planctobacterium marinum]MCC2606490.1 type II secretion system minor pseudopilin GspJ [Planctobacterium marinum]